MGVDDIKNKVIATLAVITLTSMLVAGCGSSDSVSKTKEISSNQDNKDQAQVEVENKNIDEPVLVVDTFYKAQISMDLDTALSYCSDSLKEDVETTHNEYVSAFQDIQNGTMETCVDTAQSMFWDVADEDGNVIDASYLYDEATLVDAIKKLAMEAALGVEYELPENAEMISEEEARVVLDVSARIDVDTEGSWGDTIAGYAEGFVIDKIMDDAGFVKKALFKEYVTQQLVSQIDDLRRKYENANAIPTSTRTYYLKKSNNSWIVDGYKVVRAEDGSVNLYGNVPDEMSEASDEYNEDEYIEDDYDYSDEDYDEDYDDEDYSYSEYILSYSSSEYLDEDDLEGLSAMELTYARNEVYARHGYVFKSDELNEYFQSMDWYEIDYDYDGSLSDIEKYNVEFIKGYQNDNDLMYVPE